MSQNPFETPRVELGVAAPPAARLDVLRALGDAWRAVIGDLSVVIIGGVIFFSCALASIATVLGFFLFFPVLVYGGVKMLLNLQDGIAGYSDLGEGFPRYWAALGDTLVMMLLQVLLWLPYLLFATAGALLARGPLVSVMHLAGIAITAAILPRFVFAPFYQVDQQLGAIDAMRASWASTSDQKLVAFLLVLVSLAVGSVGAACGIGVMLSVPISWAMFASAFRQLHPKASSLPR